MEFETQESVMSLRLAISVNAQTALEGTSARFWEL